MSVNKHRPHLFLIPEDDANRQLAVGFLNHYAVTDRVVDMRNPAGGWSKVLDVFETEYLKLLRGNENGHVVMLIDFDEKVDDRRALFEQRIPHDLRSRVFVLGSKDEPETLKRELKKKPFESIGGELALGCLKDDLGLWGHAHLMHNNSELQRLVKLVKPILFQ